MGKYSRFIREMKFEKVDNKNCYICNKYDYISEKHHIIPVSVLSNIYDIIHEVDIFNKYNRAVMLCPNHHAIYHKIISNNSKTLENLNIKELEHYKILIMENIFFYLDILKQSYNISKSAEIQEKIGILYKEKSKLETINKMIEVYINFLNKATKK